MSTYPHTTSIIRGAEIPLKACHCGIMVNTAKDADALDLYGDCECQRCRQGRVDFMWEAIKQSEGIQS